MYKSFVLFFIAYTLIMNGLQAQDSLEVYYIFLQKDTTTEISLSIKDTNKATKIPIPEKVYYDMPAQTGNKDFIRHTNLYKIPFQHLQNQGLLKTKYRQNLFWDSLDNERIRQKTFIESIIEGVESGKILAVMPADLSLRYSYAQLCKEIQQLENTEQIDTVEKIDMTEFGIQDTQTFTQEVKTHNWENLNEIMYLIGEEGVSQSQDFFRPRYVCVVWHNPSRVIKPHLVMIIPYVFLEKYLHHIYISDRKNDTKRLSVHDFLIGKMFFAEKKRI